MTKTKVAILYGGRSVEHGVSINSARNILEYINKEKFEPIAIGITTDGRWFHTHDVNKAIDKGSPLELVLDPNRPSFRSQTGALLTPDIVFPVLHGTDGEDGSIQGMLKALGIPMVGTGVLGSSLSMNKLVSKRMLQQAGLPVTRYLYCAYGDSLPAFDDVVRELGLPFMVKAVSLGSSVGVSKVKALADYNNAVEDSFRYDDGILFEEYITGREIECAVLGNNPPQASLPGEIVISKKYEFYTFDAKYVDGEAVQIEVPAKLNSKQADEIRKVSTKAFQALCCEDFARVDLFLTANDKIYINEINTIPGFTNSSMYPMMWKERGVSFPELITKLIELALERFEKSKRVEHDFTSALKF